MPLPLTELSLVDLIRCSNEGYERARIPLGIGDDCAILRPPAGHDLLVTTDFSLEGRHFRRDTHSPESAGHRTIARGLSDLAAMGAKPLAAFLSLALPRTMVTTAPGKRWVRRFLAGMQTLAARHKLTLAGGDTAESPSEHILADIVLTGTAPRGRALRRSTACAGDSIYVSGSLGGAAAELQRLFKRPSNRTRASQSADEHPQLFPEPRLALGWALRSKRLATSCIDLSDGLSTDLAHLCRASGLCAEIHAAALPIHALASNSEDSLDLALNGGEDYELLFTVPARLRPPRTLAGVRITRIGSMRHKDSSRPLVTLVEGSGKSRTLHAAGWEHFR